MKQNKNKKKWTTAAATLAMIAALAGTFAWFTSQDSTKNHFETGLAGNDVEIVETFDPPKDWKPGQSVKKEVAITNTGEYKSLIRVTFDETISKLQSFDAVPIDVTNPSNTIAAANDNIFVYKFSGDTTGMTASKYASPITGKILGKNYTLKTFENMTTDVNGVDHYTYTSYWENDADASDKLFAKTGTMKRDASGNLTPGSTEAKYVDLTKGPAKISDWATATPKPAVSVDDATNTATAVSPADDKIIINFKNISSTPTEGKWYYNQADGYFYYVGVVDPQGQTPILVDSVKLSSEAGNEYSKLEYDLNVKAEGIQAFKEAVDSAQWVNGTNAALATKLSGLSNLDLSSK